MGTAIKDSGKKNTKIFAVDPFLGSSDHGNNVDTSSAFHTAITNHDVAKYITTISKTSEEAYKEWEFGRRLDFLWIDGGHEYDFVAKDIQLWNPLMNLNGIIALHDSGGEFLFGGFSGVRRAIKEFMFDHENFKDYGFAQGITYATKTNRMTIEDWVKNCRTFYCWWIGKNDLSTHKYVAILLPIKMVGRYISRFLRIFKYYWKS